ncbi:hypothetical protein P280DRAFT_481257 [Massarina eburnea CBS 473.64]|uniref:Uncharacterized protein n=1 Tax=Massarina eburnea CBS 473.64 TaxID=1395130 RepID=A0A6A6RWG1_9PLEO|nr:hypothetical protein P280DRAFT_481257 [Massarina eburnea CBS 473.64]
MKFSTVLALMGISRSAYLVLSIPSLTLNSIAAGNPLAQEDDEPEVPLPSFSRPALPSFSRPAAPSFSRPAVPSFSRPALPSFSHPIVPSGSRPPVPSFSRPPFPSFSRPAGPSFSISTRPSFSRPTHSARPTRSSRPVPTFSRPPIPTPTDDDGDDDDDDKQVGRPPSWVSISTTLALELVGRFECIPRLVYVISSLVNVGDLNGPSLVCRQIWHTWYCCGAAQSSDRHADQ